jgi:hypothetical protein
MSGESPIPAPPAQEAEWSTFSGTLTTPNN